MFCEKCGGELRQEENKLVCTKCGAEFSAESEIQAPSAEYVVPRGFSSKKLIIIIIVAAILMIGGVSAIVAVNVTKSNSQTAPSGIQVAERFLSEQNYEQAIIEFEKILEIEPMNVDAYLGLAEAYIGKGDTEKALGILRKGLEQTGDARLQARIDELTKPEEPVVSSSSSSSEPVYGSMGFVTIAGTKLDIATTTNLLIYQPIYEYNDESSYDNVIHYNDSLSYEDMNELSKLSNLKRLEIMFVTISDMSFLSNLTNLTELSLRENNISDISALSGLTNLTYLGLSSNQISDIRALSGLTELTELELCGNQISDISALSGLTNLTVLGLTYNQISDISALSGLTSLTELQLQNNRISNIKPLASLTNLRTLSVFWGNQISEADIEWLKSQLPNNKNFDF